MILVWAKDSQTLNNQDFPQVPFFEKQLMGYSSICLPKNLPGPPLQRVFSSMGMNMLVSILAFFANPKISKEPSRSNGRATSAYPNAYQHVK